MRILGIDPGIGRTGWGVITSEGTKLTVVAYGCIETSQQLLLEERIESLYDQLRRVITENSPDEIAIEELFVSTNVKTALIVGQARGVVLLLASQHKLVVSEYTPIEVKLAVTGYGRSEKKQVEKMMMLLLGMTVKPKLDDASDALSVAITHSFSRKLARSGHS